MKKLNHSPYVQWSHLTALFFCSEQIYKGEKSNQSNGQHVTLALHLQDDHTHGDEEINTTVVLWLLFSLKALVLGGKKD